MGRAMEVHRREQRSRGRWAAILAAGMLCAALSAAGQTIPPAGSGGLPSPYSMQAPVMPPGPATAPMPGISAKQRRALIKDRFEKSKRQAAKLVKMAQDLQRELNKSNPDVLSVHVVKKAEKIEKLAKKIKDEAKGY